MRPLTSASGMLRAAVSRMSFGQISDSVNTARSGRQWSRKRAAYSGASSGTYWCTARGPRRRSARPAEVTVPVVSRKLRSGRALPSASISGSTALVSPTLAACTQHEHAVGARDAGLAEALAAAAAVLLAAALAYLEEERRERAQQAHAGAVGLEAEVGIGGRRRRVFEVRRRGALDVGAGERIGARGDGVERRLDLHAGELQLGLAGVGRHPDRIAGDIGELRAGQVDRHPAPGVERLKREVAAAHGTMGRPERRAIVTMPMPARRAGPGGTSAVMTTSSRRLR